MCGYPQGTIYHYDIVCMCYHMVIDTSDHKQSNQVPYLIILVVVIISILSYYTWSQYFSSDVYETLPTEPVVDIPSPKPILDDRQMLKSKYAENDLGPVTGQAEVGPLDIPEVLDIFILDTAEDFKVLDSTFNEIETGLEITYRINDTTLAAVFEPFYMLTIHPDWTKTSPSPTTATNGFLEFYNDNFIVQVELMVNDNQGIDVSIMAKRLSSV